MMRTESTQMMKTNMAIHSNPQPATAHVHSENKPRLGTGKRFEMLVSSLSRKGVRDPKALAAYIGRKKYGKGRFQKLATKGK